jgi:hypothetical protein
MKLLNFVPIFTNKIKFFRTFKESTAPYKVQNMGLPVHKHAYNIKLKNYK